MTPHPPKNNPSHLVRQVVEKTEIEQPGILQLARVSIVHAVIRKHGKRVYDQDLPKKERNVRIVVRWINNRRNTVYLFFTKLTSILNSSKNRRP